MRKLLVCAALAGSTALSTGAHAQAPAAAQGGLEEIVVTAQRRAENLQVVPVAVSALTAESLSKQGTNGIMDLPQSFPGLSISRTGTVTTFFLRGVGNTSFLPGNDPSVITMIDGVYQANPQSMNFSFNNIDHIEVLKGPQGTLFGRNATGGAIQILTKDPNGDKELQGKIGYGRFNDVTASAYVAGGSEKLAMDLSLFYENQSKGWGRNTFQPTTVTIFGKPILFQVDPNFTGVWEEFGARSKIIIKPSDDLTVRLLGHYTWSNGNRGTYRKTYPGARMLASDANKVGFTDDYTNFWDHNAYFDMNAQSNSVGGSVHVDYESSFATFKSITAYDYSKAQLLVFAGPNPYPSAETNSDSRQKSFTFTQEFQILSNPSSPIKWIGGLFYYHIKAGYDPLNFIIGNHAVELMNRISIARNTSYAAFGQVTVPLGEATNITGGIRYTWDKLEESSYTIGTNTLNPTPPASQVPGQITNNIPSDRTNFGKMTWRASIDHKITPDVMAYASVNFGYKAGAYNVSNPCLGTTVGLCPAANIAPAVKPETLLAYEVGFKSEFLDRRVRLNASAFLYKYKNLQVTGTVFVNNQFGVFLTNAPAATLYGLDVDLTAQVTDHLRLTASILAEHNKYDDFKNAQIFVPNATTANPTAGGDTSVTPYDATGKHLTRAPEFTLNAGADYTIPTSMGTWNLNASWYHNDGLFWEPSNRLRQPAYDVVNGTISLALPGDRWKLSIWGKNLFNTKYFSYAQTGGAGDIAIPAAPMTFGGSIEWKM